MRIGVDLMGSDSSPHLLFNAVKQAAAILPSSCTLVVIATRNTISELSPLVTLSPQAKMEMYEVSDTIEMEEEPMQAIRQKKNSSLAVGLRLLKKRGLDAFVSCGNTGALIAGAVLLLPLLPRVQRPALLANLPTEKGFTTVLDVGGTMVSKAHFLVQFAFLGAAYQRIVKGIALPKVGLLNVGRESKKGTAVVQEAYECLKAQVPGIDFIGNVEARDVFKGSLDVLVTDGFSGNILLKSAEGVADLIFGSLATKLQDQKAQLDQLHRRFDDAESPGGFICGIEGIVVKAHGSGSPKALFNSILGAADYVEKDIVAHLKQSLTTQT